MTYLYVDANGVTHYRTITVGTPRVSLVKRDADFLSWSNDFNRRQADAREARMRPLVLSGDYRSAPIKHALT